MVEEKPANLAEVQTKHVDSILTALDQARKDTKSNYQDLLNALENYEKTLKGFNITKQVSKVTVSVFEFDEESPATDASAFTWEGESALQKDENTISGSMAYLFHVNTWLSQQSRDAGIINGIKVENVQKHSEAVLDVRPRNWLETLFEHSPFRSQEKRAEKKQVGLAESQFGRINYALERWETYCKQFHNKFVPIMTELGRNGNEPAMIIQLQRCRRNFFDVSRIILSVIPIGYILEMDRRLNTLAQAAQSMNSANAAAMAAQAQMAANAGALAGNSKGLPGVG